MSKNYSYWLENYSKKDYGYLRKLSTKELCKMYVDITSKWVRTNEEKEIKTAIQFIVGEKELTRFLVVEVNKGVKEQDFEEYYRGTPFRMQMHDIKITLGL